MTTSEAEQEMVLTPKAPAAGGSGWRDVAVGAAFQAGEATTGLIADLRRAAERRQQWLAQLAERGAAERTRGRRRAAEVTESAVTAVATSSLVDRVVDAQLERVLRPLISTVLDDVLLLLEKEPDRIHALIRGQRESLVDELVSRVRAGAGAGDTAVDRLTLRVFNRRPRPPAPVDL
jgi:hypothetical protein